MKRRGIVVTPQIMRLAPRLGAEWTPEEDARILAARPQVGRTDRTLARLAFELDRTHASIYRRRKDLLRRQRERQEAT